MWRLEKTRDFLTRFTTALRKNKSARERVVRTPIQEASADFRNCVEFRTNYSRTPSRRPSSSPGFWSEVPTGKNNANKSKKEAPTHKTGTGKNAEKGRPNYLRPDVLREYRGANWRNTGEEEAGAEASDGVWQRLSRPAGPAWRGPIALRTPRASSALRP